MSKKSRAYKVRVKIGGLFQTRIVEARTSKKAASRGKGRVLSSSKVSMEELLKVGSFFKLGDQLMKEFEKERQRNKSKGEVFNGREDREGRGNTEGHT